MHSDVKYVGFSKKNIILVFYYRVYSRQTEHLILAWREPLPQPTVTLMTKWSRVWWGASTVHGYDKQWILYRHNEIHFLRVKGLGQYKVECRILLIVKYMFNTLLLYLIYLSDKLSVHVVNVWWLEVMNYTWGRMT